VLAQAGEVDRGVAVPVDGQAAGVAVVGAFVQRQLGFHRATGGAGLRTGVPPAGYQEPGAVPGGLVAELAAQLAEPGVGQGPVQAAPALAGARLAAGHVRHREVLNHDHLVALGQAGGRLVQRVAAQVRGPGMDPPDPRGGARPPLQPAPPGEPVRAVLPGRAALHGT